MLKRIATKLATLTKPRNILPTTVASGSGNRVETHISTSKDAIRLRAFQKWEAAGKPSGDGIRFWLEAEGEASQGN